MIFLTKINNDGSYGCTKILNKSGYSSANDILFSQSKNKIYFVGGYTGTNVNISEDWYVIDDYKTLQSDPFITILSP